MCGCKKKQQKQNKEHNYEIWKQRFLYFLSILYYIIFYIHKCMYRSCKLDHFAKILVYRNCVIENKNILKVDLQL